MRMRNIPRGLPSEPSIAEPIELGSGITDRRINHAAIGPLANNAINNPDERDWFNELEKNDPDPRFAKSNYHDPVNVMMDPKEKKEFEDVDLCEGYIKDAIMYPNGAHINLIDGENSYFVFIENVNFIVVGTKIKIVDHIVRTSYSFGSFNKTTDEIHALNIIEIEDGDNNEIPPEK